MKRIRTALTIAGFDPSGGAGIQADLKTFQAFGVHGFSVITGIAVQNSLGVASVAPLSAGLVSRQLKVLLEDFSIRAVKVGMLTDEGSIRVISKTLKALSAPFVVVDPVLFSHEGRKFLDFPSIQALKKYLFPLASLITPNQLEARVLLDLPFDRETNVEDWKRLLDFGSKGVLVTGIQRKGASIDLFIESRSVKEFSLPYLAQRNPHGTGCVLSSAIAANAAGGMELRRAIGVSKKFLWRAMKNCFRPGRGKEFLPPFIG